MGLSLAEKICCDPHFFVPPERLPRWRSIWEVMKDTIMLESNFSGVGVDLKVAHSRFLVTANIN
jgi:hypothetical protein